jgi:hypothetical protein
MSWRLTSASTQYARNPGDTKINVKVSNVMVSGQARDYAYSVTFIRMP